MATSGEGAPAAAHATRPAGAAASSADDNTTAPSRQQSTTLDREADADEPMSDAEPILEGEEEAEKQTGDSKKDGTQQPPPPPPPPPPGPRAARLQDLFASSLRHTLARLSWPNFAACYPTAAARAPQALQTVHAALVDRLGELCQAEFQAVLRARDVVRRLNELEALAADAARRRGEAATTAQGAAGGGASAAPQPPPPPPHTLPPETVMAAHLRPHRREQRALLEGKLKAAQAANADKFARLAAQQREAGRLAAALERALADAAAAAALLDGKAEGEGGEGGERGDGQALVTTLARETRAAEADMAGL